MVLTLVWCAFLVEFVRVEADLCQAPPIVDEGAAHLLFQKGKLVRAASEGLTLLGKLEQHLANLSAQPAPDQFDVLEPLLSSTFRKASWLQSSSARAPPTGEEGDGCWGLDYEFGNMERGACAWAPLVAFHGAGSCLASSRNESWWPIDVREVEYSQAAQCQQACLQTGGCDFWAFDTRQGECQNACWLKRALQCARPFADAPGFISGPARCSSPIASEQASSPLSFYYLQMVLWPSTFAVFCAKTIAGAIGLVGIVGVIWKLCLRREDSSMASEPRLTYRLEGIRRYTQEISQTQDNVKGSAAPKVDEASVSTCSKQFEQWSDSRAYDY